MDMNKCASTNLEAANAALNKIYQQIMAQQSDAASKEQLKNVERAWNARSRSARKRTAVRSGRWK